MAESNRRKDADENLPEELDDAVDDDASADDESLMDELDDDQDEAPVGRRRGGLLTRSRAKADSDADKVVKVRSEDRVGIFGRLFRFFREVVAELRKVIWPTRKELLTYAAVVIVFVTVMLTIVASLDAAFAWSVLKVFGGKSK